MSSLSESETTPPYDYEICHAEMDRSGWHPKVSAFYDYWLRISPPAGLPGRQHFDPLDIPALLSNIWIREVHRDPLRFRARLIGTKIVAALGVDLTGKWLHEAHSLSPSYKLVLARFEAAVEGRMATYGRANINLYVSKEHLRIENVTVPLARDGETVDMLVGYSWITFPSGSSV